MKNRWMAVLKIEIFTYFISDVIFIPWQWAWRIIMKTLNNNTCWLNFCAIWIHKDAKRGTRIIFWDIIAMCVLETLESDYEQLIMAFLARRQTTLFAYFTLPSIQKFHHKSEIWIFYGKYHIKVRTNIRKTLNYLR